jgi:tetratricopeptide (TPR) repeat protein
MQGDYSTARSLQEESLALNREIGDKRGIALSLNGLGIVAQMQGDYPTARSLYEESLSVSRELGDKQGIALTLGNIGNLEYSMGEYSTALTHYKESLLAFREIGDKHNIAWCLGGVGGARAQIGQTRQTGQKRQRGDVEKDVEEVERGARLLGAAEALLKEIGSVLEPEDRIPYDGGVSSARSVLGEERFERLRQEGQAMSMEQAIEYALGES